MKPSEKIKEKAEGYRQKGLNLGVSFDTFLDDRVQAILDYLDNQEKRIKFLEDIIQQLSTKKLE